MLATIGSRQFWYLVLLVPRLQIMSYEITFFVDEPIVTHAYGVKACTSGFPTICVGNNRLV